MEVGTEVAQRTHAFGVVGLALVAVGLLAAVGGVVATITDAVTSGSAQLESMMVPEGLTGSLGNLVFEDRDDDGRRDPDEPGIAGVTVELLDPAGRPALTEMGSPVGPEVTDPAGHYAFTRLAPGTYRMGFADLPERARFGRPSREPDVDDDSDADPATGMTQPIDLSAGERDLTIDVGVFIPAPSIAIETRVQGLDADVAPGPTIAAGAELDFDYLVTNTGNERLVDLVVTDDKGITVNCDQTAVAAGQTVLCSGVSVAVGGLQRNVGAAAATGAESAIDVVAEDPVHHTGGAAGLVVEKQAGGEGADTAVEALQVPVGSPVTYTFTVTNTTDEPVVDVSLDDVGVGPVTCPAAEVAPAATLVCEARTLPAAVGLSTNVAVARGRTSESSISLEATDAASVFGRDAHLVLLKEVYEPARRMYLDGDATPGSPGSNDGIPAFIEPGATARYRLQVTNTGNVDLPGASVADVGCDDRPELILGDHGVLGTLEVGEAWTLRCTRKGVTDSYTNTAEATANGLTVIERAHVETIDGRAAVEVEKLVQGPGASGFGPTADVEPGQAATFRIRVTNVGTRSLVDLAIRDPQLPGCDRDLPGPLEPGETTADVLCSTDPLSVGFRNEATVTAAPLGSADWVTAVGSADVTVSAPERPDLALTKASLARSDDQADWVLTVRNLGPGPAAGIGVIDDLPPGLAFAGASGTGWMCTATDQLVSCDGPELAEGASSSVVLETRLVGGTTGELRNTARLAAADGNGTNDTSSAALPGDPAIPTTSTPTTSACPPTSETPTTTVAPTDSSSANGPTTSRGGGSAKAAARGGANVRDVRLARTGVSTVGFWITGIALIALGILLLWSGRRRRRVERIVEAIPTQPASPRTGPLP